MSERKPVDGGVALENEKIRYEQMLGAVYKFRFFFVGLVFAMLSFAMQYPVSVPVGFIKNIEFVSWLLLIYTGFLALRDCGGFSSLLTEKTLEGLTPFWRSVMWKAFLTSVILLFLAKAMDSNYAAIIKVDDAATSSANSSAPVDVGAEPHNLAPTTPDAAGMKR